MSKEAIAKVVQRAISDAGFRRQLSTDPTGALRGFDLTADEAAALRAGDAGRLSALGVDQRMSKLFVIGGVALTASRQAGSDLTPGGATSSVQATDGGAMVSGTNANAALIDDGGTAGARSVIPGDPESRLAADADNASGISNAARANDDPDGFLAANANADLSGSGQSVRVGDDWKFTSGAAQAAPIEGSPEAAAADIAKGGGMAAYPAHGGLAGPSAAGSARAGDDWARASGAQADTSDSSASSARGSVANDDPDGFLAANARADLSGGSTRAINDDQDGFLAANANADLSGGAAAETAFVDESEGYLTTVGYDPNAATSAVTDAHDRGSLGSSAVTDAHDRGSVTRVDDDADADGAGTKAASEGGGPNLDS